ncbi:hypothetical protein LL033_21975 [Clostridium estertheticum]|uniref:hypothetical protein n=1 Tax=Clostridium estertheticum TaxID=238834 RepID=UPI001C0E0343|nr:hypothetical protein [Clostridium estertheticum]MBU3217526.1 hypothetical protein [Clostridium estertheticum]WAG55243.1 hypothetical protein LL033_21975 [Clostridium estertheticum]
MIFKGIGATTHIDGHNMKMSKEALESAADQINKSGRVPSVGLNHDKTIMPFGKIIEAEVSIMDDGEYKIEITQEIFENAKVLEFNDGEKYIEQKSESDKRPFVEDNLNIDKIGLGYDLVNFESQEALDEFLLSLTDEYDIELQLFVRKQLIPDPEIIFAISSSVFGILVGKKLVDKVIDKFMDKALVEVDNFYNFVRSTISKYIKYAIPKNRPITYVFQMSEGMDIELIAITLEVELLMRALEKDKIQKVLSRIEDFKLKFVINKVQFLLNNTGEWEFNYLLTTEGAVIGSEKSYSRNVKAFELFGKEIKN